MSPGGDSKSLCVNSQIVLYGRIDPSLEPHHYRPK